uniref:Uncharacterized protein n=1 Tax=Romanomermis culicivorax TaxID=13658 RepID=A0A915JMR0_ROMCU
MELRAQRKRELPSGLRVPCDQQRRKFLRNKRRAEKVIQIDSNASEFYSNSLFVLSQQTLRLSMTVGTLCHYHYQRYRISYLNESNTIKSDLMPCPGPVGGPVNVVKPVIGSEPKRPLHGPFFGLFPAFSSFKIVSVSDKLTTTKDKEKAKEKSAAVGKNEGRISAKKACLQSYGNDSLLLNHQPENFKKNRILTCIIGALQQAPKHSTSDNEKRPSTEGGPPTWMPNFFSMNLI